MIPEYKKYFIGINLGFAVNRFPEPEEWTRAIEQIGVKRVQFVADLLNPSLPRSFRYRQIERTQSLCRDYGISVESAFTGAFTRVNHFGSRNPEVRNFWIDWFAEYARQMSVLGVTSIGGHPGILSINDDDDKHIRKERIREIAGCWANVFESVGRFGIETILWEPMSISREIGHTLEDAQEFQELMKVYCGDSVKLCLDLDHGDIESSFSDDTNPISWIDKFNNDIGALHLKQTTPDRRKNLSFTPENNQIGTVDGTKILAALVSNFVNPLTMYLELSFRERNPDDRNAIYGNRMSVQYWQSLGASVV